jgi:glycosyltransferase involved in cell wall biosynthesis
MSKIYKKPLVTFALVSYNQEKYIADAVQSALNQNYTPLQIILSDDCSGDKTFEIMKNYASKYRGPHQIVLNRNVKNIGVGSHVNKIMELAEGEWIIGAAGDDISLPERTEEIINSVRLASGKAMSVWSRAQHMSENGKLQDRFEESNGKPYSAPEIVFDRRVVMGCSHAWHRDIFKIFGPLNHNVMFEDNALSFRSFLMGSIIYIDKTLVHYRQHENNITNYVRQNDRFNNLRKMNNRRYYSIIGIHQRLMDLMSYERARRSLRFYIKFIGFLLIIQLIKQKIKYSAFFLLIIFLES